MAVMISIALCRVRLPVATPSLALHHASEIAGAAHNGSVSDLAPLLYRSLLLLPRNLSESR
jgi:hypothetical protein